MSVLGSTAAVESSKLLRMNSMRISSSTPVRSLTFWLNQLFTISKDTLLKSTFSSKLGGQIYSFSIFCSLSGKYDVCSLDVPRKNDELM